MNSHAPLSTLKLQARSAIDIKIAQSILRSGGIVALPTETVYGLAGSAFDEKSIEKIFLAKNRPANNPLILHTHSLKSAKELFLTLDERASRRLEKLAAAFWPGPLTIIGPKAKHIPLKATGGLSRVAVRIPQNSLTLAILEELDFPLVMPSANLSTRPSPTTAMHVLKTLAGRIDAVVDDGACLVGIESSVISIDEDKIELLRLGKISAKDIAEVVGEELSLPREKHAVPQCPGQAYLHYAPKVKQIIFADENGFCQSWHDDCTLLARVSDFERGRKAWGERSAGLSLALNDEAQDFAKELYASLYRSEEFPDKALVLYVPQEEGWDAINDRLRRSIAS